MKLQLVFTPLILLCCTRVILGQLTFVTPFKSQLGTSLAANAANGKIVTITSYGDYSWIMADLLYNNNYIPQEYYVTLICATNVVDFGFQATAGNSYFDTSRRLLGDTSAMETDRVSVYYPNQPTGGTTTPVYITSPGQTLRWTATRYGGSYIELRIRDMNNTHLLGSPINLGGNTPAPANGNFYYGYYFGFGFEILNCGQAKFCIQTLTEYTANPGLCDDGNTTVNSCAANTCTSCDPSVPCATCAGTKYTCATCPVGLYFHNGQCLFSCPTGYIVHNRTCYATCPVGTYLFNNTCRTCDSSCSQCSGTRTNCVACGGATPKFYNSHCYATCPSGTYQTSPTSCATCGGFCSECSVKSTNCTSCHIVAPLLHNNNCLRTCPAGTYQTPGNTCEACESPCGTCTEQPHKCTSCQSAATPLLYNNWCRSSCPSGTYQSSATSCQPCIAPCVTCQDAFTCTSCANGLQVDDGVCKKKKSLVAVGVVATLAGSVVTVLGAWAIKQLLIKRAALRGADSVKKPLKSAANGDINLETNNGDSSFGGAKSKKIKKTLN